MKHIALRSMSVRKSGQPYTTPGLGDMIHTVLLAFLYSRQHNTPVTLHLTSDKWNRNKPETYQAILSLLPIQCVYLRIHNVAGIENTEFLQYVRDHGYPADMYHYGDYLHKHESVEAIDISNYLKTYPCIPGPNIQFELPTRFVTAQWDSNAEMRRLSKTEIEYIEQLYQAQGLEIVRVGGEAENEFLKVLPYVAHAMSRAELHIGVDSGFMHMAQLYMRPEQIHVYTKTKKWSHHLKRAVDNGCVLNYYLENQNENISV